MSITKKLGLVHTVSDRQLESKALRGWVGWCQTYKHGRERGREGVARVDPRSGKP